jgi:hypothetical protein|tara:strand:- start:80659 stop:80817 length:159 start_codon:yes stop_codon:yes gene_type:complete
VHFNTISVYVVCAYNLFGNRVNKKVSMIKKPMKNSNNKNKQQLKNYKNKYLE